MKEFKEMLLNELKDAEELRLMYEGLKDEKSRLYQLGRENELRQLLRMLEGLK